MADSSAGLLDLLRIGGALLLVIGLVLLTGRLARRGVFTTQRRKMSVEERLPLARGVQAVVLSVEGRRMLLGVSERGVNLVAELPGTAAAAPAEAAPEETPAGPTFSEKLAALLRKGAA